MKTVNSRKGYFRATDNTKLFYSIEGTGKIPLVFCYGLVSSKAAWKYQMEYFKKNHPVVWLDYRGHRNSSRPEDLSSITIESIADDTIHLLEELGFDKYVVLGHSMGVNVATSIYKQTPESVVALVLANGTPRDPLETLFGTNLSQTFFDQLKKGYMVFPSLLSKIWGLNSKNRLSGVFVKHLGFNPVLVENEDVSEFLKNATRVELEVMLQLLNDYSRSNIIPWLNEIKVPTLVISGEKDRITPPENQKMITQQIDNSELFTVRNGSHCPQIDLPDLVNMKIEMFLSGIDSIR